MAYDVRPALDRILDSEDSPRDSFDLDEEHDESANLIAGETVKESKPFSRHQVDVKATRKKQKRASFVIFLAVFAALLGILAGGGLFVYKHDPTDGESPPWYPSPRGGTAESWKKSYDKAKLLVDKMSLIEKVNITTGVGWQGGFCVGNTSPALEAGFPALCLQDGPLGLRFVDNVTLFPAGITVGATFNRTTMYRRGRALGKEARLKGINVLLGPSMGPIGKIPAGGRNWEGFGTDPVLQGIAAAQTIKGIQDEGVMATAKHLVGNEQEHFRQAREWGIPHALSSNIDDRALHEIYAWPFADSVRAGVASVMCSYNMVNNSYACGNSKLMNGLLKDELGFQGFVHSDWLAQRGGVSSALAGLDMTMPGDGPRWEDRKSFWGEQLTIAALNGSLPMERLNDMAIRIVASWYQLKQDTGELLSRDGPNFSSWTDKEVDMIHFSSGENETGVVNKFINAQGTGKEAHGLVAREVAAEGMVLAKNTDGILPLAPEGFSKGLRSKMNVGVYGEDAGPGQKGLNACPDRGCSDGTLAVGWGSGTAEFPYLITPIEALERRFDPEKVVLTKHLSNKLDTKANRSIEAQDLCIVFVKSISGEGFIKAHGIKGDRNDLFVLDGGDDLVKNVATHCGGGVGSTIVVIHSVGPVVVEKWADHPNVKAILFAHLPGQESGNALADVLFGDRDAGGRFPYTVGKSLEDYGEGGQVMYWPNAIIPYQDFRDGIFIDYRYFDQQEIAPRYEFGYGLSYSTFEFSNVRVKTLKKKSPLPAPRPQGLEPPSLDATVPDAKSALFPEGFRKVKNFIYTYIDSTSEVGSGSYPYPDGYDKKQEPSAAGGGEGGNPSLYEEHVSISLTVTNTGERRGSEVVQVYVSFPINIRDENDDPIEFPAKVLRGFEKVEMESGKKKDVEIRLTRRDLSYWSVVRQNWVMPEGEFKIMVGKSSRNILETKSW